MAIRDTILPWLRAHGAQAALEILFNFALPYLIFSLAQPHWGDVKALIASSGPPIVWTLIELALKRRVDALSMLVLAGIALSLLAFVGGGGARFLQLREKLVTFLIGLVFLGSAAIGKPLIYELARATLRRRGSSELAAFESLRDNVHFRRSMTVMTLVWGFGLVGEALLASLLVFTLTIKQYLLAAPILGNGVTGALALWTFLYVRSRRAMGARRAAAEAEAAARSGPAPPG